MWSAFAGFRDSPITQPQRPSPFLAAESLPRNDTDESHFIDWIWQRYGGFSGFELSDMTHEQGTPWYKIAKANNFRVPKFLEMGDDENRAYFSDLARQEGLLH